MDAVKLATCRMPPDRTEARVAARAEVAPSSAQWLRFGDELVYTASTHQWPDLTAQANRAGLALQERSGTVDRQRLHVVVQKGRLFQREHPEVPVLIDKGRFLLVDMDPELARRLAQKKEPCFSVRRPEALEAADEQGANRVVFAARSRSAGAAVARAPDPAIQALVDRISGTTYKADLAQLVALPTRYSTSSHYRTACDFAEGQFSALGYATSRQTISVNGSPSMNVVARRTGTGLAPRNAVIVTAHLDSVNDQGTSTSPAPGADDDGSGSAGVIEIARALKDKTGVNDLVFALFGGEEQGLFGSKHFVQALSPAQRSRVRAVINMDMIGTLNTQAPAVLLEGAPLSQTMLDGLAAAAATYTGLAWETSLNPERSDHVSFLDKGIPAVLTIEGADSANDEVHTARDTLDRINIDLAVEILRMNTAYVAETLG